MKFTPVFEEALRQYLAENLEIRLSVDEFKDSSKELSVSLVLKATRPAWTYDGPDFPEIVLRAKIGI